MSTINIDDKDYAIESLPDEAKGILGLMQANAQKQNEAQVALGLAQAAHETLSAKLKLTIKSVKPIPTPRVKTSEAGGNRTTRRATASKRKTAKAK